MQTITQIPLGPVGHRNHQLFSDYYLEVSLPRHPEWQRMANEARAVMERIKRLFESYAPSENEAQTEHDLVRPVLEILGHTFEVQASLETPAGAKRPDYIFYRDSGALNSNKGRTLNEELLRGKAFAVGDAKYWDRPLDISLKHRTADAFTNANPSYQIFFYMQHSGVEWGILTNGRLWRLYHRDTAHKLDRYYEVDLPELLETGDVVKFLYFYAFFRRSAFEPGPLSLEAMLRASADYARGVGESLKTQVYEALRHLAQGLLDYPANRLDPDPETLRSVYDSSLIVLYRLLFALYAESRGLLPLQESQAYRESYSLYAIKHEVARNLDEGRRLLPSTALLWPRLRALFDIINRGSPPLRVATFNGGLFDPERHAFLEHNAVRDAHLQQAIDKLARVDRQFVDYRDLAERHLGTIYEGLLEYHLVPLDPPEGGWRLDLLNDKGERKATGSYYTPDYVVKYIVDQTVGPVLREAVESAGTDEGKIRAVLDLNVLDPAMGSGHFLVEATEYIARYLVERNLTPEADAKTGEAELAYWKRRVVQACIYGVDLNPLAVELAKLSLWLSTVAKDRPLSFLDHHLRAGNSLVGARISDLQEVGDLRRGTARRTHSWKAKQQVEAGQLSMLDTEAFRQSMMTAVDSMWLIESSPARTVEDVKQQERVYASLHAELTRKYARLADLVTATRFGVEVDGSLWQPLADYATGRVPIAAHPKFDVWLAEAEGTARKHRFFHWELEFPEVFFDKHGNARGGTSGFDAVVGNPPYVRQETIGDLKPYFAAAYPETYHGVADLYVYFIHQALRMTHVGGRMSYIVTNKWMRAGYGEPLREYLASQRVLERIIDFGHAPIFEDADVFPCIVVCVRREVDGPKGDGSADEDRVRVLSFPREKLNKVGLDTYAEEHSHTLAHSRFGGGAWTLETSAVDDLWRRSGAWACRWPSTPE